jgi:hypothetical protein
MFCNVRKYYFFFVVICSFASPTLKQWPILDPELGSPKEFKDLLLKYANVLNQPGMMIGSYVTAPNT